MKPGDTFLTDLGRGRHLHVVLSHPTQQNHLVVATMISTYDDDRKNSSCVIRPEDGHPFIKHFSYVVYEVAGVYTLDELEAAERQGSLQRKPPFSPEVLERILRAADKTESLFPNRCWIILDDQGLIPK